MFGFLGEKLIPPINTSLSAPYYFHQKIYPGVRIPQLPRISRKLILRLIFYIHFSTVCCQGFREEE